MDRRDAQALAAAKLYYLGENSQDQVAAKLGVSRPTVVKLLQRARAAGFVRIDVVDPSESLSRIAAQLQQRFALTRVQVVQVPANDPALLPGEIGRSAARLLTDLVKDGMSVGIGWGNTMLAIARSLSHTSVSGAKVVQLKGGSSRSELSTNDFETMHLFCAAFNATSCVLPLPVIFDDPRTKAIVERDSHISQVLREGREVDLAVFTVGDVHPDSLLLNLGYFSRSAADKLLQSAVGDVCSRFYTESGQVALREIDELTVGISIDDLRGRPLRLLVAGGAQKVRAIRAGLRMGLATHLVIDSFTAEKVLAEN
ncbi:MAG: sugar-binding transcriptional regulator [Actinomycetaceae bacterium]|nr:sugar-binding transcriptional regulator [Actinomycetaceae bacterium]